MKKELSPLADFFFQEYHPEINDSLFRFQSELASFAVTLPNTSFYKKESEGIRPLINQQMKFFGSFNSKPSRNHFDTYKEIALERLKQKSVRTLSEEELKTFVSRFELAFKKHQFTKEEQMRERLFEFISLETLTKLVIVAEALGGRLTYDQFLASIKNLGTN